MRTATLASLFLAASWLAAPDAHALEAGGLAPPAPGTGPTSSPAPKAGATEDQLQRADEEDAGRGLEFAFIAIEGGGAYVGLKDSDELGSGPLFGAQIGARLLYFTGGPRFRFVKLSDRSLWTLNLDMGLRIPLGRLEPHVMLGGGYARVSSVQADAAHSGFDVRLGAGVDYYVTNAFSIGGALSAEYGTVAFAVTAAAVAGLHF
jgi:hypothetical protein